MSGRIIAQIFELKAYMAGTAAVTLLLCGLYLLSLRRFRFGGRGLKLHGLFAGLSARQQLLLSVLWLRFCFVLFCIGQMRFDRLIYAVYLLGLGVSICVLKAEGKQMVAELINTALLSAGLYTAGLLAAYMREIRFEWNIMAVYLLLSLFMALYTLYFFLRDIKLLSERRRSLFGKEAAERETAPQERE